MGDGMETGKGGLTKAVTDTQADRETRQKDGCTEAERGGDRPEDKGKQIE